MTTIIKAVYFCLMCVVWFATASVMVTPFFTDREINTKGGLFYIMMLLFFVLGNQVFVLYKKYGAEEPNKIGNRYFFLSYSFTENGKGFGYGSQYVKTFNGKYFNEQEFKDTKSEMNIIVLNVMELSKLDYEQMIEGR